MAKGRIADMRIGRLAVIDSIDGFQSVLPKPAVRLQNVKRLSFCFGSKTVAAMLSYGIAMFDVSELPSAILVLIPGCLLTMFADAWSTFSHRPALRRAGDYLLGGTGVVPISLMNS